MRNKRSHLVRVIGPGAMFALAPCQPMTSSSARRAAIGVLSLALLGACSSDKTLTAPNAAPPDSLAAKFPSAVGQIAFTSNRDGPLYIYVAAADGSKLRRLAAGVNAAWSRDGQQIAFNGTVGGTEPTSDPAIYVVNADGSGERPLPIRGVGPVWSPDGRQLAYTTDRGIYVANSDGSDPRQLVSSNFPAPGDTVGGPAWSPDAKRVAFSGGEWIAVEPSGDVGDCTANCGYWRIQLYVVNTDGSGIQALAPYALSASWSPDGSMFAFGAGDEVGIANADGSGERTVSTSIPFPNMPDWSPDGRVLSFTGGRSAADVIGCLTKCFPAGTRIYATDPSLGATIQLIPDAVSPARWPYDDFQAVWSRAVKP